MKQLDLVPREKSKYRAQFGGSLMTTRAGRAKPRSVSTRETMHVVLRSTHARGEWSFRRPRNESRVQRIVAGATHKYGVKLISLANVGNHLHMQLKFGSRQGYLRFIRVVTGAIAKHVMSAACADDSRTVVRKRGERGGRFHFWDRRPFTRIVVSLNAILNLRDYVAINRLEGAGFNRDFARYLIKRRIEPG